MEKKLKPAEKEIVKEEEKEIAVDELKEKTPILSRDWDKPKLSEPIFILKHYEAVAQTLNKLCFLQKIQCGIKLSRSYVKNDATNSPRLRLTIKRPKINTTTPKQAKRNRR